MRLLEHYRFRVVNISQFYPRPGTAAFRMERTPTKKVKERSSMISALFRSFGERHAGLLGSVQRVTINESETVKGELKLVGHTKNYTKVVLPYDPALLGTQVLMRITRCFPWHVEGTVLADPPAPISKQ
jgi:threonylcarbamoyladenosine tRNA methylthiotransferase CDKAL1